MEPRSDTLSVVREYMAGWNAHDAELAARSLDADVEYYDASVGEPQHGMEAARDNVIAFFLDAVPDLTWTMVDEPVVVDGSDEEHVAERKVGPVTVTGDGPLVVREKSHPATPMTLEQALYEMELVGHDFYLFVDKESEKPSVVYRRRGYDYGVISLEVD